ncbi:chromosome partitioning protein ParA [Vibrio sonorensis]|uniref:chromosome partitioning protein ParA n=1 Tax=Vibrio sonorensis TaxID=1004316 RepID=UPI0008D9F5B0|nr:chromosome partitioning protein ParA [Vibrio sonorensis]
MVSINGLPPSQVPGSNRSQKTNKSKKADNSGKGTSVSKTTKVADAVAHSIRYVDEADIDRAKVQYDLPEGKSRQAMQEYLNVMNQAKREELNQLLGVDIYI